jgi:hypothetical protein
VPVARVETHRDDDVRAAAGRADRAKSLTGVSRGELRTTRTGSSSSSSGSSSSSCEPETATRPLPHSTQTTFHEKVSSVRALPWGGERGRPACPRASSLSSPMWSRLDRSRMRFIQCERDALSPARAASFILIHVHDNRALVAPGWSRSKARTSQCPCTVANLEVLYPSPVPSSFQASRAAVRSS